MPEKEYKTQFSGTGLACTATKNNDARSFSREAPQVL